MALQKGYVTKAPHFNSVSNYLEDERMTAYLKHLITESSLPLRAVEDDFAVDSSGFSVGAHQPWQEAKYGWMRKEFGASTHAVGRSPRDWMKVHVMCGCKTNVITSVEVTNAYGADTTQFPPLVEATARNFVMNSVCADKAYSSEKNLKLVLTKHAMPYIPFKSDTTGKTKGETWRRMYHFFQYNRPLFDAAYHRRSNVETTFSMIKRKFGERLRSKTATAQINEVLCKVLCHNLCCLISAIYELGIVPTFWE